MEQPHDVLAHQRLAAREPELPHALGDEGGAQAVQLLQREQVGPRQERHVLGHAIDAAEIAAVRDRYPQIGYVPAEGIHHGAAADGQRGGGNLEGHVRRPEILFGCFPLYGVKLAQL